MLEISTKGTDLAALNRDLEALKPKKLMRKHMNPLGKNIVHEVEQYPPPIDNNRTGKLGRSWYYRTWGMNLDVGNVASYAGYVQGEKQTERHRRTGWKRLFEVAITQTEKLIDKVGREIDRIWRT